MASEEKRSLSDPDRKVTYTPLTTGAYVTTPSSTGSRTPVSLPTKATTHVDLGIEPPAWALQPDTAQVYIRVHTPTLL